MYDVKNMANAKREIRFHNETMMNRFVNSMKEQGFKVNNTYDLGKGTDLDDGYFYVTFICTGKAFLNLLQAFTLLREEGTCIVEYLNANGWDYIVA